MRVFGGERVKNLMGTFGIPENEPIKMKMLTNTLESAQTRIEGFHFDARKQVLAYDDVLNLQRMSIYARRGKLLVGDEKEVEMLVNELVAFQPAVTEVLEAKKQEFGEENFMNLFRRLSLQVMDTLWVEHLEVMSYTRNSVNLRAYGQRDPLIEYRKEGTRLFKEMQQTMLYRVNEILPRVMPVVVEKEEEEMKKQSLRAQQLAGETTKDTPKSAPAKAEALPGRNDMVTITDGNVTETMKFKKAEPLISSGWKIVTKD